MITQGEVNVGKAFGIKEIEKFFMEIVPNQHAKAYLVGMATDFGAYDQWKNTKEDMLVKVYTGENILFAGYVKTAECCFENRIHHIILELVSTTEGMDRVRKSKSFQDVSASYKEIIEDCVSEEQAACTFDVDEKKIGRPIIRYRETTWEFAIRMASHFHTVIYPIETASKPSIWFGCKTVGMDTKQIKTESYSHGIDERYWKVKGKMDAHASDFEYYRVTSYENLEVGQCVIFDNRKMYILEKRCKLKNSVLEFEYIVSGRLFLSVPTAYRRGFAGLTVLGKILCTDGENVKLHLAIDTDQNAATAYFYQWVPDTGSVMYCMPEKGTTVSLYFPDEDERNAIAVSCIRENGAKCQAMTDTEMKNFANPTGKQLYLHPEETGLKMSESNQMIELSDARGVDIGGTMKVGIYAADEIKIEGRCIKIDTPKAVQMVRT